MNKTKILYKGLFLSEFSIDMIREFEQDICLEKKVPNMHVTFDFKPDIPFPEEIMDNYFVCSVYAYGNDGKNAGFLVNIPAELRSYYTRDKMTHITSSLSEGSSAVDTHKIRFHVLDNPFPITVYPGYYTSEKIVSKQFREKSLLLN